MPLRGREREAITSADKLRRKGDPVGRRGEGWWLDIQGEILNARCFKRNKDSRLNYGSRRKR